MQTAADAILEPIYNPVYKSPVIPISLIQLLPVKCCWSSAVPKVILTAPKAIATPPNTHPTGPYANNYIPVAIVCIPPYTDEAPLTKCSPK